MTTLYIREVPEEVAATLKNRAAERGMSLSAYVAGELTRLAARPTNQEIADRLRAKERATGPTSEDIVASIRSSRR